MQMRRNGVKRGPIGPSHVGCQASILPGQMACSSDHHCTFNDRTLASVELHSTAICREIERCATRPGSGGNLNPK